MENILFECVHCFQEVDQDHRQTWNESVEFDTCKLCMEWFDTRQRSIKSLVISIAS